MAGYLHPWEGDRATQLLKGKRSLGPYSLAMAKGFSTSILPQSAIVTSFRGLSRPSVLVLSTFRTTSWGGRQCQACPAKGTGPSVQLGGLRPTHEEQRTNHEAPKSQGHRDLVPTWVRENPALTRGGCRSFDPLKYHPGWARGMLGREWGEGEWVPSCLSRTAGPAGPVQLTVGP